MMDEYTELKSYLRKLMHTIDNAEFSFGGYKLVKKDRVDDLLCCTFAVLPDLFKEALKNVKNKKDYPSVIAYDLFSKDIRTKFFFSKDLYIFSANHIKSLINNVGSYIPSDMRRLERLKNR